MINRRDNNVVSIFSYIFKVWEALFHHQLENCFRNDRKYKKKMFTTLLSLLFIHVAQVTRTEMDLRVLYSSGYVSGIPLGYCNLVDLFNHRFAAYLISLQLY